MPPKPKAPPCRFVVGGQLCGADATAQLPLPAGPLPLCAWHATRYPGATTALPS